MSLYVSCRRNGTAYGDGVYFSGKSETAIQFASDNGEEFRHVFLCRVLCGRWAQGQSGLKEPPPISESDPTILHDSVVDNIEHPKYLVIFNDAQVLPQYLITLRSS